ncbi:MAG: hypothetical protein P1U34_05690 [Coxiellaceae bacterium]|nr:hypothetical protein [Coxiellaceae bacterium]
MKSRWAEIQGVINQHHHAAKANAYHPSFNQINAEGVPQCGKAYFKINLDDCFAKNKSCQPIFWDDKIIATVSINNFNAVITSRYNIIIEGITPYQSIQVLSEGKVECRQLPKTSDHITIDAHEISYDDTRKKKQNKIKLYCAQQCQLNNAIDTNDLSIIAGRVDSNNRIDSSKLEIQTQQYAQRQMVTADDAMEILTGEILLGSEAVLYSKKHCRLTAIDHQWDGILKHKDATITASSINQSHLHYCNGVTQIHADDGIAYSESANLIVNGTFVQKSEMHTELNCSVYYNQSLRFNGHHVADPSLPSPFKQAYYDRLSEYNRGLAADQHRAMPVGYDVKFQQHHSDPSKLLQFNSKRMDINGDIQVTSGRLVLEAEKLMIIHGDVRQFSTDPLFRLNIDAPYLKVPGYIASRSPIIINSNHRADIEGEVHSTSTVQMESKQTTFQRTAKVSAKNLIVKGRDFDTKENSETDVEEKTNVNVKRFRHRGSLHTEDLMSLATRYQYIRGPLNVRNDAYFNSLATMIVGANTKVKGTISVEGGLFLGLGVIRAAEFNVNTIVSLSAMVYIQTGVHHIKPKHIVIAGVTAATTAVSIAYPPVGVPLSIAVNTLLKAKSSYVQAKAAYNTFQQDYKDNTLLQLRIALLTSQILKGIATTAFSIVTGVNNYSASVTSTPSWQMCVKGIAPIPLTLLSGLNDSSAVSAGVDLTFGNTSEFNLVRAKLSLHAGLTAFQSALVNVGYGANGDLTRAQYSLVGVYGDTNLSANGNFIRGVKVYMVQPTAYNTTVSASDVTIQHGMPFDHSSIHTNNLTIKADKFTPTHSQFVTNNLHSNAQINMLQSMMLVQGQIDGSGTVNGSHSVFHAADLNTAKSTRYQFNASDVSVKNLHGRGQLITANGKTHVEHLHSDNKNRILVSKNCINTLDDAQLKDSQVVLINGKAKIHTLTAEGKTAGVEAVNCKTEFDDVDLKNKATLALRGGDDAVHKIHLGKGAALDIRYAEHKKVEHITGEKGASFFSEDKDGLHRTYFNGKGKAVHDDQHYTAGQETKVGYVNDTVILYSDKNTDMWNKHYRGLMPIALTAPKVNIHGSFDSNVTVQIVARKHLQENNVTYKTTNGASIITQSLGNVDGKNVKGDVDGRYYNHAKDYLNVKNTHVISNGDNVTSGDKGVTIKPHVHQWDDKPRKRWHGPFDHQTVKEHHKVVTENTMASRDGETLIESKEGAVNGTSINAIAKKNVTVHGHKAVNLYDEIGENTRQIKHNRVGFKNSDDPNVSKNFHPSKLLSGQKNVQVKSDTKGINGSDTLVYAPHGKFVTVVPKGERIHFARKIAKVQQSGSKINAELTRVLGIPIKGHQDPLKNAPLARSLNQWQNAKSLTERMITAVTIGLDTVQTMALITAGIAQQNLPYKLAEHVIFGHDVKSVKDLPIAEVRLGYSSTTVQQDVLGPGGITAQSAEFHGGHLDMDNAYGLNVKHAVFDVDTVHTRGATLETHIHQKNRGISGTFGFKKPYLLSAGVDFSNSDSTIVTQVPLQWNIDKAQFKNLDYFNLDNAKIHIKKATGHINHVNVKSKLDSQESHSSSGSFNTSGDISYDNHHSSSHDLKHRSNFTVDDDKGLTVNTSNSVGANINGIHPQQQQHSEMQNKNRSHSFSLSTNINYFTKGPQLGKSNRQDTIFNTVDFQYENDDHGAIGKIPVGAPGYEQLKQDIKTIRERSRETKETEIKEREIEDPLPPKADSNNDENHIPLMPIASIEQLQSEHVIGSDIISSAYAATDNTPTKQSATLPAIYLAAAEDIMQSSTLRTHAYNRYANDTNEQFWQQHAEESKEIDQYIEKHPGAKSELQLLEEKENGFYKQHVTTQLKEYDDAVDYVQQHGTPADQAISEEFRFYASPEAEESWRDGLRRQILNLSPEHYQLLQQSPEFKPYLDNNDYLGLSNAIEEQILRTDLSPDLNRVLFHSGGLLAAGGLALSAVEIIHSKHKIDTASDITASMLGAEVISTITTGLIASMIPATLPIAIGEFTGLLGGAEVAHYAYKVFTAPEANHLNESGISYAAYGLWLKEATAQISHSLAATIHSHTHEIADYLATGAYATVEQQKLHLEYKNALRDVDEGIKQIFNEETPADHWMKYNVNPESAEIASVLRENIPNLDTHMNEMLALDTNIRNAHLQFDLAETTYKRTLAQSAIDSLESQRPAIIQSIIEDYWISKHPQLYAYIQKFTPDFIHKALPQVDHPITRLVPATIRLAHTVSRFLWVAAAVIGSYEILTAQQHIKKETVMASTLTAGTAGAMIGIYFAPLICGPAAPICALLPEFAASIGLAVVGHHVAKQHVDAMLHWQLPAIQGNALITAAHAESIPFNGQQPEPIIVNPTDTWVKKAYNSSMDYLQKFLTPSTDVLHQALQQQAAHSNTESPLFPTAPALMTEFGSRSVGFIALRRKNYMNFNRGLGKAYEQYMQAMQDAEIIKMESNKFHQNTPIGDISEKTYKHFANQPGLEKNLSSKFTTDYIHEYDLMVRDTATLSEPLEKAITLDNRLFDRNLFSTEFRSSPEYKEMQHDLLYQPEKVIYDEELREAFLKNNMHAFRSRLEDAVIEHTDFGYHLNDLKLVNRAIAVGIAADLAYQIHKSPDPVRTLEKFGVSLLAGHWVAKLGTRFIAVPLCAAEAPICIGLISLASFYDGAKFAEALFDDTIPPETAQEHRHSEPHSQVNTDGVRLFHMTQPKPVDMKNDERHTKARPSRM